jgi:hypothetical protein
MYYHPHMFDWANGERTLAVCQAFVGVWLDGVARQQQAHADAVSMFCARQVEGLRMATEARDAAQFAARLLSCAAPDPHGCAELSARLAGIVVDTRRELGELAATYGDEMTRSVVELGASLEKPHKKAANGGRAGGRRRVAA